MPTFISFFNRTAEGRRDVKEGPDRLEAMRAAFKDLGGEIKDVYFTMGQYDVVVIAEAPDGESMAKFNLAIAQKGAVRTTTVRAFTEDEYRSIVADLP